MQNKARIAVLGGGIAGLTVGYYARRSGIPFKIYEKAGRTGGNCVTFQHGDFLYDSGAHRVHDSVPEVIDEIRNLLGDGLSRVEAPSKIYHRGRFIDFPLSPFNLFLSLGFRQSCKAVLGLIRGRLTARQRLASFEDFAVATYGRAVAEKFLLNYSEKLWGLAAAQLSPVIAGSRLKGLDLRTFVFEALGVGRAKSRHLEGMGFYYPRGGFGKIPDRLAEFCGAKDIVFNAGVTRIAHDGRRVLAIEFNGRQMADAGGGHVVSTIPISQFIAALEPKAPDHIIKISQSLRFRHMVIAALFVDRNSFTNNATIYFPDADVPFTRIYEPRNRSVDMAPAGRTSLVFEIPCQKEDPYWTMGQEAVLDMIRREVVQRGWLRRDEILGGVTSRLEYVYPVLEKDYGQKLGVLNKYLQRYQNVHFSGRSGLFAYSWVHDMFLRAKGIVANIVAAQAAG